MYILVTGRMPRSGKLPVLFYLEFYLITDVQPVKDVALHVLYARQRLNFQVLVMTRAAALITHYSFSVVDFGASASRQLGVVNITCNKSID